MTSRFNVDQCKIPTIYCGKGDVPDRPSKEESMYFYTGAGDPYRCMQKGFGAGSAKERSQRYDKNDLRIIKYVGDEHVKRGAKHDIRNIYTLRTQLKNKTVKEIERILKDIFLFRGHKNPDKYAYNMTLMYLYEQAKFKDLPSCINFQTNSKDSSDDDSKSPSPKKRASPKTKASPKKRTGKK